MSDETKINDEINEVSEVSEVSEDAEVAEVSGSLEESEDTDDYEPLDDLGDDGDFKPSSSNRFDASAVHHLSGMYQNWFLDYASYVILERAVPHLADGLKPVQRRIMHSMKRMDDGRFNKVANIVGHTMQFHPHGDASIGDALVQLGQKDLLVECQGNWGNILTGDRAAAPRYIEARLSKFALEVLFNNKTTEWKMSYDGRNEEPIVLPAKFPLLLAQGAEGIAVGLSSKILPHNFNELCDAAVSYLNGEEFNLFPDFPTGGSIDVAKYNDGLRGGSVKVRAKIEKVDQKTLAIREIPFGKTSSSLIETILKAIEKGKVKARKVEDNTAAEVEILVHLAPGISSDKTIDALYAFTDCELSISPNCCVIEDKHPRFMTVSEVLKQNVDFTLALLKQELEIRKHELQEQLHFCSLEKIFIEERIYKDKEFEEARSNDEACEHIDERLTPWYPQMIREVTKEDILRLLEIKMQRILKFNSDKAEEQIVRLKKDIKEINKKLKNMVGVTIDWFTHLKEKYGAQHPRLTEIRNFDTIEATKVVEANQKLYINEAEGFIGTGLKKDDFVCNCSDIDDIIIFYKNGKMKVVKVADKIFVGQNIIHVQVFKKNDTRTVYNMIYRDGKKGVFFVKRFNVLSVTRDREYDLTQGTPGSYVKYFTANPNGEAEVIKVTLDFAPKIKKIFFEKDFSEVAIKGKTAKGNILTKQSINRITLKSAGRSTLGGRKVWYDKDVNRLNYDSHGELLGEFNDQDAILVILDNGEFYITNFDANNHFEDNILFIEKYNKEKIWTAVVEDADQGNMYYLKRFPLEATKRHQSLIGDNPKSKLVALTDEVYPLFRITYLGPSKYEGTLDIDAEEFIMVKSSKAKGKRITTSKVVNVEQLESVRKPEPEPEADGDSDIDAQSEPENLDPEADKSQQQIIDEMTGQTNLFDNPEFQ